MSDYVIKGQTGQPDGRLVVINEADWTVEVDESPVPNYVSANGTYYTEVTDGKKLVFIRKTDGQVKSYGNVDPYVFWDEKSDNTFWENNSSYSPTLSWGGSSWTGTNSSGIATTAALKVPAAATWIDGYKPLYAKVVYTLSGGGDLNDLNLTGCCGRGTTSSTSSLVAPVESGEGIIMVPLWESKDEITGITFNIPAGETLTISGIYFSKTKFNEDLCDGYGYSQDAFDEAVTLAGTEPNFSGSVEIMGASTASSYDYGAGEFTVSSVDPLTITVESSTPRKPPRVSIFSDRTTQLIGSNTSGAGWRYSGTEKVEFQWTPPSADTYTVMVKNDSILGAGKECDTFNITVASGTSGETPASCEGYTTLSGAVANTVSGTLATEQTWSVDAESYYGMYYGDGSDLGGVVNIDASASTAFTMNFMEQTYSDLVENLTSDFYWGVSTESDCQGTQVGSGSGTSWDAESWNCTGDDDGATQLKLLISEGTNNGAWSTTSWRPDTMKIYFTGPASLDSVGLRDDNTSFVDVGNWSDVTSGEALTIDWTGGGEGTSNTVVDMLSTSMSTNTDYTITKIEFITEGAGSLEWTVSSGIDSSNNGGTQEVVTELDPSGDWRIVLHNAQTSCVDIDMTVTHSGSSGSWDNYTSNTYWGPTDAGSWDGSEWDSTDYYGNQAIALSSQTGSDSGAWTSSYQPTQMRVTYTGNEISYGSLGMYDGGGPGWEPLESGVPVLISDRFAHAGDYISNLMLISYDGSFSVTDIEFSFDAYEYPCQARTSATGAIFQNAQYQNADWTEEHFITIENSKYGGIGFTNASSNGWTIVTVVNEDNSATSGFTVYTYDGNGDPLGNQSTTSDTLVGNSIGIDGGSVAFGEFYVVIYNSGGSACEEFSINITDGN